MQQPHWVLVCWGLLCNRPGWLWSHCLVTLSCCCTKVPLGLCCPACCLACPCLAQEHGGGGTVTPCDGIPTVPEAAAVLLTHDGDRSPPPRGLAAVSLFPGGYPSPGLGLGLPPGSGIEGLALSWKRSWSGGIKPAECGAEGKGLLSNGRAVPSHPREVFPLLQRAHGPSVRLPERQQLHPLVQGPHLLHWHAGCLCEDHALRGHQVSVERLAPHPGHGCASHRHLLHHLRPAAGLPARPDGQPGTPHPLAGWSPGQAGRRDGDQPPGAHPHQDAVPPAQLQGAGCLHPVGSGSGRVAVPLEGLGTHRAAGRPLLGPVLV